MLIFLSYYLGRFKSDPVAAFTFRAQQERQILIGSTYSPVELFYLHAVNMRLAVNELSRINDVQYSETTSRWSVLRID